MAFEQKVDKSSRRFAITSVGPSPKNGYRVILAMAFEQKVDKSSRRFAITPVGTGSKLINEPAASEQIS
jgi:hypothetical protein